jgi:pantetheine-phosphate adenylyltransferase
MTALLPGTFDPVTLGHMDIISRASSLFDKLIVAVLNNVSKKMAFSIDERLGFLTLSAKHLPNVTICEFSGLLSEFFVLSGSDLIIRGLRNVSEYEHELQYAYANRSLNAQVETFFLPCSPELTFLSSSLVKEVAAFGGPLESLVPSVIIDGVKQKF